ncbi:YfhO family protein, partial [Agromyces seonyuensis]
MDEVLLLASRLLLLIIGAGGSVAFVVAAARRRIAWLPAVAAAVILLGISLAWIAPAASSVAVELAFLAAWMLGFPMFAATFPDGRFVPRWSLWLIVAGALALVADLVLDDALRQHPAWAIVPASQLLLGIGAIAFRYRRSASSEEREAVRWVLLGLIGTLAAFLLIGLFEGDQVGMGGAASEARANLAGLPMSLGFVIGVARPRLWNVDVAFRATLVVLGVGWGLVGAFALASASAGMLGADPVPAARWSAAAVAAAAYPLTRGVQRLATWLVFRTRLDPAAAVVRLGAELDADDARSVAQRIVDVAASATGSTAVELVAASDRDRAVFEAGPIDPGSAAEPGEPVPVTFRGELLATLLVAPRAGESDLGARDRSALAAIARHAAPALDGARSLQESRAA